MNQTRKYGPALLLVGLVTVQALGQAPRPVRVMQESPWVLSPLSGMRPVQAYWDPQSETHFIDLVALLEAVDLPVEIDGAVVRTTLADTAYDIDFASGIARADGRDSIVFTEGGFIRDGQIFLLTPPNLQQVFPDGALTYDASLLQIRLSPAVSAPPSFRARATTLARGPLLYGRSRKLIGGTQLGYRISRVQRHDYSADYYGSLNVRANALWGRIQADGTLINSGETTVRFRQLNYLLDFPESPRLTQIGLGRTRVYRWPVREVYEGVRLSNRPLSTRHQQRETRISGIAEPNALVSAFVGGVLADRVQADGQGRYSLSVPTSYGTSRATVEIMPAAGGVPVTETRHLFVSEDLAPAGTFYWDLHTGRNEYDHSLLGYLQSSYGLTSNLTAQSSLALANDDHTATLGLVRNFGGFAMTSAEVAYPARAGRVTLQLVRDRFQLQGEAAQASESDFMLYKQRLLGRLGWNFPRLSLFVDANRFESFGGRTSSSLNGSGTVRVDRKTSLIVAAGPRTTRFTADAPSETQLQWRTSLTRYAHLGTLHGRLGLQADGGRYEDVDFAGVTLYATYRSVSFGARVGYDVPNEQMNASLSLRMNAPWAGFSSNAAFGADARYHQQTLYGSMAMDRGLTLSRHPQVWSSALLSPFLDADRNGQRDPGEAALAGTAGLTLLRLGHAE